MKSDLEINKALALAIGWKHVLPNEESPPSLKQCWVLHNGSWREFDYTEWAVIGPIAERYSMFPQSISTGNFKKAKAQGYTDVASWEVIYFDYKTGTDLRGEWKRVEDTCPKRAIAMAVIGANK